MDRLTIVAEDQEGAQDHGQRPPTRAGQPWTDEDYEDLVEAIRAGKDVEGIARAVGRSVQVVQQRLTRMLPVDEQGCVRDRALGALRAHLADPAYDWQRALLLKRPPAPIVHEERVLEGLSGLPPKDLVTIADALLDHGTPEADTLVTRLNEEVGTAHLWRTVQRRIAERMLRLSRSPIAPCEAQMGAATRVTDLLRLAGRSAWQEKGSRPEDGYSPSAPQDGWADTSEAWVGRHRAGRGGPG